MQSDVYSNCIHIVPHQDVLIDHRTETGHDYLIGSIWVLVDDEKYYGD